MEQTNRIFIRQYLRSLMMILMMAWMGSAWAQEPQEVTFEEIVATWDWHASADPGVSINKGKEGDIEAYNGVGISLHIIANTGKFTRANKDTNYRIEMGATTEIQIPVRHVNDVVTITTQKSYHSYTIGGVAANADEMEYKAKPADVAQGYVKMVANAKVYVYSISVKQIAYKMAERAIYSTKFQDDFGSSEISASDQTREVAQETKNGDKFTFNLYQTEFKPNGTNTSKFDYTDEAIKGWLMSAKISDAYIETTSLPSITKVTFKRGATGSKRGWKLWIKGDGDDDWVDTGTEAIPQKNNKYQDEITYNIEGNRKNVKLRFTNLGGNQNAYLFSLDIYGMTEVKEDIKATIYDTDGTTILAEKEIPANKKLSEIITEDINEKVTVPTGSKFRGWFDGSDEYAQKVRENDIIGDDINLYAKATPEEVAENGNVYSYNMNRNNFYQEDHELIEIEGGEWKDAKHGWYFENGGTILLPVAGHASIDIPQCEKNSKAITITDGGTTIDTFEGKGTDGTTHTIRYDAGTPTTLTVNVPAGSYIHSVMVRHFKRIILSFNCQNVEGATPQDIECDKDGMAKLPNNAEFYREGWTFKGWTDGTNEYEAGRSYLFQEDVTLTNSMTQNTIDLTDTNHPAEVTWELGTNSAPAIAMQPSSKPNTKGYTRTTSIYVDDQKQEKRDIRLWMDASTRDLNDTKITAKVDNSNGEGIYAQINNHTFFTLPAVYGMQIKIKASEKDVDAVFGGDSPVKIQISGLATDGTEKTDETVETEITDSKNITLTYKGAENQIKMTFVQAGKTKHNAFYQSITAIYPVLPNVVTENVINNPDHERFPDEKEANAGTATVTPNTTHTNTGKRFKVDDVVTITANPGYGYTIKGFRKKNAEEFLPAKGNDANSCEYTLTQEDATAYQNIVPVEVVYERQEMKRVIVKSSNTELGNVTLAPKHDNFYKEVYEEREKRTLARVESWFTVGTQVTASTEAETNYMLGYWAEENSEDKLATNSTYQFTITQETPETYTLVAHFQQGFEGTVIFDIHNAHVNQENANVYNGAGSMQPDAIEGIRSFVIPTNYTIFKNVDDEDNPSLNNYTLDHWKGSNGNIYEIGKQYSFSQENERLVLTPEFKYNPTTQENRVNDPVLRYDFGRSLQNYDDPTSKTTRKVAAQEVNIGSRKKFFWTAQVYTNSLDDKGQGKEHWRDVALWCDTGEKGYVRNKDFDDWCAIGPGTSIWMASCTNAIVSILTYSPITTTTIDGKVPTLDKTRTEALRAATGDKHQYIYTSTVTNTADRIEIKIGDDYSYYKWIEAQTYAANWVTFHHELNEESRGAFDEITTPNKDPNEYIKELENGDHSFHKGERVKMTFHRKKGYELDEICGMYQQNPDGTPITLLKMTNEKDENGKPIVKMVNYDFKSWTDVRQNPDGSWGKLDSGEDETMWKLTISEDYDEGKTAYLAEDSIRTKYEIEFNITSRRSLRINFKENSKTHYISYNPGSDATGLAPDAEWVEAGDQYLVPRNQSLYYVGNTLHHWVDGDNKEYLPEVRATAPDKDVRMFPVFEPNKFSLLDLAENATATWNMTKADKAPTINYEGSNGILVTQLSNGTDKIDVKIDLMGEKGKFNNTYEDNTRIQINQGSVIKFPSTPRCEATLLTSEHDNLSLLIAGTKINVNGDNKATHPNCPGTTAYETMDFNTTRIYSKKVSVTYKPQDTQNRAEILSLTCEGKTLSKAEIEEQMENSGHVTFTVAPWKNKDEAMPELTGTATNGTLEISKPTLLSPSCAVTVKTQAGISVKTYPVQFLFEKPTEGPKYVKLTVNGVEYTAKENEIFDMPESGVVKVEFDRIVKGVAVDWMGIKHKAETSREQVFKYWNMPDGATFSAVFGPTSENPAYFDLFEDLYGMKSTEVLKLTLHVKVNKDKNHHHKFDFIVGEDGDMDEAVKAANGEATGKVYNNTKEADGHRYYIFVPDGEYELTGNSTVSWNPPSKETDNPKDETGKPRPDMNGKNNHMTYVKKPNVSLIGQSKEGVTIWNRPIIEGIAYTATLDINKDAKNFYAQDLTLENRFDYWGSINGQSSAPASRAGAFVDRANRTVLKNVAMVSWQDTYYSANGGSDYRGYMEDCDLAGVVDWICGSGDIWFEHCNLLVRDRSGNNIAAPHTELHNDWGYVFNDCSIKPYDENPAKLQGNDWTLARPWSTKPSCTFLNTRMYTQPRYYGWGRMTPGLELHFHEYNSMYGNGNELSLETRSLASCAPGPGSDDCVLKKEDAADYTILNVVGGTDVFEPHLYCRQINAKTATPASGEERSTYSQSIPPLEWDAQLEMNDDVLQWNAIDEILCYFVFKQDEATGKWKYIDNTTDGNINLYVYGSGYYCVRAANQRGGLGTPTDPILYTVADPYELEIKQVGDDRGYGWSTICLPVNSKKPEEVTVYAATAHNATTDDVKVTDYKMTLTEVNVVDAEKGYIVYGPVGIHTFRPTSRSAEHPTILSGNKTSSPISSTNVNCYVMADKTWGLGFYKFSGSTLAANRAWLPQQMLSSENQMAVAAGKKAVTFVFADDTTPVRLPGIPTESSSDDALYNLSGQRIQHPTQPGVYISRGKSKVIKR